MHGAESKARRLIPWLGEACKDVRKLAGVSQGAVARAADLAPSGINRFEKGKVWPKDPERIVKAYASTTGYGDSRSLWRIAIGLWERYGADVAVEGASSPVDLAAALDEYLERKFQDAPEVPEEPEEPEEKAAG